MGTLTGGWQSKHKAPCLRNKSDLSKTNAPGFGWTSTNWSGYAVERKKGSVRSVAGEWTVPKVNPKGREGYSSIWIGIDGFSNGSLIQAGTEQDVTGGSAHYYAWWEILPDLETKIPFPVFPADRIQARIERLRGGKWSIRLTNRTRKWTFRIVRPYSGPRASAEWIVEAPQVNGRISRLVRYGRVAFTRCRVNGTGPGLQLADGGVMNQSGVQVSTPSPPWRAGDGFRVAYGSSLTGASGARERKAAFAGKRSKPLLLVGKG